MIKYDVQIKCNLIGLRILILTERKGRPFFSLKAPEPRLPQQPDHVQLIHLSLYFLIPISIHLVAVSKIKWWDQMGGTRAISDMYF